MIGYTAFATAIGPCAVAWGPVGLVAVQLPEGDERSTIARLLRRHPEAQPIDPPPGVGDVITAIIALLDGESVDLSWVEVDLSAQPGFHREVLERTRLIAQGTTTTYGAIAADLGDPAASRAVGQALGANPVPIVIPCHRVIAADGGLGGFSARGGVDTKRRMLRIEGYQESPQLALFEV